MNVLRPDEMWEVFHNEQAGVFEWICGWAIAHELLNGGMTSINGVPCDVQVVDRWPVGIQLRATCDQARRVERRWAA